MKSTSGKRKLVFCGLAAFLFIAAGPWEAAFGAVLESKLTPTIVKAGQRFGNSISISGDTAVIGAPMMSTGDSSELDIGYVFVRSAGTWTTQGRLTLLTGSPTCASCHGFDGSVGLNFEVAASGDTAIAAGLAGLEHSSGYQVRIFERSSDTWTEKQVLLAANGAVDSTSPIPVAVDGDTIALGTTAAADVYVRNGGAWTVQQSVVPLDMSALTLFGHSLALSGDTMAVAGASSSDNAVYVFVRSGSGWNQEQRIFLPAGAALPGTWFPVALSGDTLLIGAPSAGAGSVYVYERSGGTWTQLPQTLSASDAAAGQAFGFSLAVDGNRAVIGAKTERAAYVFTRSTGTWFQQEKIIPPSGGATMFPDKFPISLSGDTMLIGASGDSEQAVDSGAAYVYVYPKADLSLQKTGDAASVNQNDTVTYTLTVTNNDSTTDATGVTITDTLPAAVSFESASAGCTHAGGTVTCGMGTVAKGTSAHASITVRADTPGDITNTASVSADQPDPDMTNNAAAASIQVNTPPTISQINDQSTKVNMPLTLSFTVGDAETPVSDLTVTATSSNTTLVPGGLSVIGLGPSRTLTITPAVNQAGTTVISISVSDGMATTVKSFVLTVINTPPTLTPINDQTGFVNTDIYIPFAVGDGETSVSDLTVSGTSSNTTLVPDLAFSGTDADRTLKVTPAVNQVGTTEITVSVSDGIAVTSTSFTLTVLNTPSGSNVKANPAPGVTVTFSQVTAGGNTTVETSIENPGPVSEGFVFGTTYYDIITTAVLASDPTITVCFSYVDTDETNEEWDNTLQIQHLVWDDIASKWVWTPVVEALTSRDTVNNVICGTVNSLSWFGIGYDNAPPTFTLKRLKDTLWPPNNRMVRVATVTNVADNTDPSPTVDIRVSSTDGLAGKDKRQQKGEKNEKHGHKHKDKEDDDAEHNDNRHARDWKVRKRGDTWEVWVRAERAGKSADRIYTITATVTDRTGNHATESHTVLVPHDKNKKGTQGKKPRNNRRR